MLYQFFQKLINLKKSSKIMLQAIFDFFAVLCSLILMKTVNTSYYFFHDIILLLLASFSFSVFSFLFGLYNSFVRFFSTSSLIRTLLITSAIYIVLFLNQVEESHELYSWISSLFFTFTIVILPRLILRDMLGTNQLVDSLKTAIIGNDYESYELLELLKRSKKYKPVCFLVFKNKSILSNNIWFPELTSSNFIQQAPKLGVDIILAPKNTINKIWFNNLIKSVEILKIPLFKSKGVDEVVSSNDRDFTISPISLTDLTLRSPQPPIHKLLKRNLYRKTVMVTGGGGSIGSELCKQIFFQKPQQLIILEASEYNLYQIEQNLLELTDTVSFKVEIITILCSILDQTSLTKIFQNYKIDTVFHAAAYKHVPLVEVNALASFENNVVGTKNVAELCSKYKVSTFTLVSTDKAVNPTNIMGVTKRLAEMFCQAIAEKSKNTTFTIVRFGNVLGSSGSVIPKFENQITAGGPITVTHRDINRFFMSITEAAELVIQATAMAKKCKIFVLDMGKPINILDLAKRLCTIRGLSCFCPDEGSFSGDIEIKITGLRSGEKMYEEVLATDKTFSTEHPRIFSAEEDHVEFKKLLLILNDIKLSLELGNAEKFKEIFSNLYQVNYCNTNLIEFCSNLTKKFE